MNVAADYAVGLVPAGGLGHRAIAEVGQVLDCLFYSSFEIGGERTLALPPLCALAVVPAVARASRSDRPGCPSCRNQRLGLSDPSN